MRRRLAALVAITAITLSLTACFGPRVDLDQPNSPEETTSAPAPATREDLEVVEVAYGRESYDSTVWWYVVIVDNPNTDYIFSMTSIDVEALDASGVILDTSPNYVTLLSGKHALTGTFFEVGSNEIAELNVRGPVASEAISSPADETGSYTFEEVGAVSDSYSTTVSGIISGTFAEEQTLVSVTVVARDAAGTIIAADVTYVDRLPVDGKVRFEVTFFGTVLPSDATYEVSATP